MMGNATLIPEYLTSPPSSKISLMKNEKPSQHFGAWLISALPAAAKSRLAYFLERVPTTSISPRHRKKHDPKDFGSREAGQYQSRARRAGSSDAGCDLARSRTRHSARKKRLHFAGRTA